MISSEQKTARRAPALYGFSAPHRAGEQGTQGEEGVNPNLSVIGSFRMNTSSACLFMFSPRAPTLY